MSDTISTLRRVLKEREPMPADRFGAAIGQLLGRLGLEVDDPRLSAAILGPSEDGADHPCLQHVIIWETTSCVIPLDQALGMLAELYAAGANPNRVDQGHAALEVLFRGIDEHGSWAGDLSPVGRVLLQAGANTHQAYQRKGLRELLAAEGQDALAAMVASQEQFTQLHQITQSPEGMSQRPRRGL